MGRASRPKPRRLAEKLLQIRVALGLSQNELLKALGLEERLFQGNVSGYELGTKEPPLPVLLAYARSIGVSTDALIDDELDLPETLTMSRSKAAPSSTKARKARR